MRIIFMGSPDFSLPALDALLEAGHDVVAVYCQPPRPAGRGKGLRMTPVEARTRQLGLQLRHPTSLKTPEAQSDFAALKADVAVVVAYGLLLPQAILDMPKYGCVNIHASLLPRWRGAAPIHRAIMAGDKETGISIMQMEAGLDTGPVILQERTEILQNQTTAELHDHLAHMGGKMIVATLDKLPDCVSIPQDQDGITYAKKIEKSEARIDWAWTSNEIDRHIRGLSPFPGAWTKWDGTRVKLLLAETVAGSGRPGLVLDDELTIACGQGALRLLRLQREGRSAQDKEEFLRGQVIPKGSDFS